MMRSSPLSRVAPALLLAAGCATSGSGAPPPPRAAAVEWQSPLHRDHPLVGRIWDVAQGRWVDEAALREQLSRAHFVLLGERHDNADHHRLQAALVRAMTETGRRPALVFEMLDLEQQSAIDAALAREPGNPDAIAQAVDWARSGWPDWALYRPIFAAGLERGLPIIAANFTRAQARKLAMSGMAALEPEFVTRYGLDTPLPEETEQAMREEMFQSHCGYMPREHLEPMVLVQRVRDARMAERMRSADPGEGAILITGSGHARTDRGVPARLALEEGGPTLRSVAFLEVSPDKPEPQAYAEAFGTGRLPFDYVWFTPVALREDPCEQLKERMRRGGQPPAGK
jgi:uncharacterized iron-regulated protein